MSLVSMRSPAPVRGGGNLSARRWAVPATAVLAAVVWLAFVRPVDPATLGSFGLVAAVSPGVLVALGLLSAAFVAELRSPAPRSWLLAGLCLLAVLGLYGLQPLTEPVARLPVAWLHAGWSGYIAGHGTVLHHFDARYSWPAFFAVVAWLATAAGGDPTALLAWAPPVFTGLAAIGVHAIAAAVLGRGRAAWLATWLFLLTNWVEQDYFSPQAFAYLMYLGALVLVLRRLCRPGLVEPIGVAAPWRRDRPPMPGARPAAFTVVLLVCALAPTHQSTPFALAALLVILAACGRLWSPWLAVLAVLVPLTWLVLGASDFWVGHFDTLFGGVGDVSGTVQQNVGDRLVGDAGRDTVLAVRFGLAGLLLAVAAAGWWELRASGLVDDSGGSEPRPMRLPARRRRARMPVSYADGQGHDSPNRHPAGDSRPCPATQSSGRTGPAQPGRYGPPTRKHGRPWALAVVAVAPFGLLALQSYGGEMLLRSYLYALPLLCTLGGAALARPLGARHLVHGRLTAAALAVLLAVTSVGLVTARGGNDAYVAFTADDVAVVRAAYRRAHDGDSIAALDAYAPLHWSRIATVPQVSLETRCPLDPREWSCVRLAGPDLVVVTAAEDAAGVILDGLRPGWTHTVTADLVKYGGYRVRVRRGDAVLLERIPTEARR
jgi:hypothetical protein